MSEYFTTQFYVDFLKWWMELCRVVPCCTGITTLRVYLTLTQSSYNRQII